MKNDFRTPLLIKKFVFNRYFYFKKKNLFFLLNSLEDKVSRNRSSHQAKTLDHLGTGAGHADDEGDNDGQDGSYRVARHL